MTSDVGRLNVVAYFPDLKRARAAIDSLQSGGFNPLSISLLGGGANGAPSGDRMPSRLLHRAVLGGLLGTGLGALVGLLVASLGLTFAPYLDDFGVQAGAFAFYGFDAGAFVAVMTGAGLVGSPQLTDVAESGVSHQILVTVHAEDQAHTDHAEELLRGQAPTDVERFAGDSPPPAALAHPRS